LHYSETSAQNIILTTISPYIGRGPDAKKNFHDPNPPTHEPHLARIDPNPLVLPTFLRRAVGQDMLPTTSSATTAPAPPPEIPPLYRARAPPP
jgi:hypothetical protein